MQKEMIKISKKEKLILVSEYAHSGKNVHEIAELIKSKSHFVIKYLVELVDANLISQDIAQNCSLDGEPLLKQCLGFVNDEVTATEMMVVEGIAYKTLISNLNKLLAIKAISANQAEMIELSIPKGKKPIDNVELLEHINTGKSVEEMVKILEKDTMQIISKIELLHKNHEISNLVFDKLESKIDIKDKSIKRKMIFDMVVDGNDAVQMVEKFGECKIRSILGHIEELNKYELISKAKYKTFIEQIHDIISNTDNVLNMVIGCEAH